MDCSSLVNSARELTPSQLYVCFVEVPCGRCAVVSSEELFIEELGLSESDDSDGDAYCVPRAGENNKRESPSFPGVDALELDRLGKMVRCRLWLML